MNPVKIQHPIIRDELVTSSPNYGVMRLHLAKRIMDNKIMSINTIHKDVQIKHLRTELHYFLKLRDDEIKAMDI